MGIVKKNAQSESGKKKPRGYRRLSGVYTRAHASSAPIRRSEFIERIKAGQSSVSPASSGIHALCVSPHTQMHACRLSPPLATFHARSAIDSFSILRRLFVGEKQCAHAKKKSRCAVHTYSSLSRSCACTHSLTRARLEKCISFAVGNGNAD